MNTCVSLKWTGDGVLWKMDKTFNDLYKYRNDPKFSDR